MSDINITESTIALIDSLKSTTGAFGLAGTGSEYKIVTEMFLPGTFSIWGIGLIDRYKPEAINRDEWRRKVTGSPEIQLF